MARVTLHENNLAEGRRQAQTLCRTGCLVARFTIAPVKNIWQALARCGKLTTALRTAKPPIQTSLHQSGGGENA